MVGLPAIFVVNGSTIIFPCSILKSIFKLEILKRLNSSFFNRLASWVMAGLSFRTNPLVERLPPPLAVVMIGLISLSRFELNFMVADILPLQFMAIGKLCLMKEKALYAE